MAKHEAGEFELKGEAVPIEEIIDRALQQSKKPLSERNVEVHVTPGLPLVRADVNRAQEILVQLIDNANLYSSRSIPSRLQRRSAATASPRSEERRVGKECRSGRGRGE